MILKTDNLDIESLVCDITINVRQFFGENCTAVYIMGSLARGGFSNIASDIDIGIIFTKLRPDTQEIIDRILSASLARFPLVKNAVSIFWGAIATINGVSDDGRYPPFDRLDLIDHAKLLSGNEIRDQLVRPSKKELEIASAEFSIEYLGNTERVKEFHDCDLIAEKGVINVTKTILYPARFIYLEKTGRISGNDTSYEYYTNSFSGYDADLVEHGYFWRCNSLPEDLSVVTSQLRKGLIPLYLNFIDLYINKMKIYEETELRESLTSWRKSLTSSGTRFVDSGTVN